jgi:hypothetical protein
MAKGKLTDEQKGFVVQALACFDTPKTVADALRKEFNVTLTPQSIEAYDPTKRAGRAVSQKWRELFAATRKAFLEDTAAIAISHRPVRLRALQRLASTAEDQRNIALAAQLLEQAAKEMGGAYTNLRKIGDPDGKPLFAPPPVTPDMTPKEAAAAYADTIAGGANGNA